MYIDLGAKGVFSHREIIGIFDLDSATVSKGTRDFLAEAEKNGEIITVSPYELPASFTLCAKDKTSQQVYVSPASVNAVARKTDN